MNWQRPSTRSPPPQPASCYASGDRKKELLAGDNVKEQVLKFAPTTLLILPWRDVARADG